MEPKGDKYLIEIIAIINLNYSMSLIIKKYKPINPLFKISS